MKEMFINTFSNYSNHNEGEKMTETVTISKEEYNMLKKKAAVDEDLLISLVKGLEDIKAGRITPWKKVIH
jgi:hypothetical protein